MQALVVIAAIGRDERRVARVVHRGEQRVGGRHVQSRRTALLDFNMRAKERRTNHVREVPKFRPPDPPREAWTTHRSRTASVDVRLQDKSSARCIGLHRHARRAVDETHAGPLGPSSARTDGRRHGERTWDQAVCIPLALLATEALKAFDAMDAWGSFRVSPMDRMWKTAAAEAKIPDGTAPDDLRHSFRAAIIGQPAISSRAQALGMRASHDAAYTLAAVPAQLRDAGARSI